MHCELPDCGYTQSQKNAGQINNVSANEPIHCSDVYVAMQLRAAELSETAAAATIGVDTTKHTESSSGADDVYL